MSWDGLVLILGMTDYCNCEEDASQDTGSRDPSLSFWFLKYSSLLQETIIEFLNLPSTKKERSQLIQVDLNSVYNVDLDSMKAIAGGAPAALRLVQKYPSADGKPLPTPRPRKRKM